MSLISKLTAKSEPQGIKLEWSTEGVLPLYQVLYRRPAGGDGWVIVRALNPRTTIFMDDSKLTGRAYVYELAQYDEYQVLIAKNKVVVAIAGK